jgi:hypothetical protein
VNSVPEPNLPVSTDGPDDVLADGHLAQG